MALKFLNNGYFAGKVGIGVQSPSYKLQWSDGTRTGLLDTNIGTVVIGSVSDDALALYTNLTEKMRITSGGNVGIGTTNPSYKLHVKDTVNGNVNIAVENASTGTSAYTSYRFKNNSISTAVMFLNGSNNTGYAGASSLNMYQGTSLPLGFVTNNLLRMTVTGGGNVGIGTANPLQPFQVDAGSNIASFRSVGSGQNNKELLIQTGGDRVTLDAKNADDGTATSLAFELGNSEKARLTTTGLGIGTTSPSSKLQVSGDAYVTEEFGQGVAIANKVAAYGGEFRASGASAQIFFGRSSNNIGSGAIGADSTYVFRVWTIPGFGNPFVIKQDGTVGIGTTSPGKKLDVVSTSGTSIVQSLRNPSTSWNQYALTRYGTEGADFRYMDFGYFRGNNNEATRGLVVKSQANATLVTFLDTGNVGIGTTDPSSFNSRGRNLVVNSNGDTGITISANTTSSSTLLFADAFAGTGGTAAYRGAIEYDHASDSMAFSTSATERIRINSSGNVGIGTTSPNNKLDIYSNENVPLRIHRPNNSNLDSAGAWGIGFSTRGDAITSTTDTRAGLFSYYNGNLFLAANNTRIDLDPDSYARLTILNTGSIKFNAYNSTNNTGTPTYILGTDSSGNVVKVLGGDIPGGGGTVTGTGTTGRLTKFTDGPNGVIGDSGIYDSSNAVAITINGNEEVGIGQPTPFRKLHVNSGTTNVVARFESTDTTAAIEFKDNNGSAEIGSTGDNLVFFPAGAEKMRITSGGNVGIGTTAATSPGFWYDATNKYLAISHWATPPTPAAILHLSDNSNNIDVPQIIIEGRDNPSDTRLKIAVKDPQVRFLLDEGSDAVNGYGLMTFETTAQPNAAASERGGFDFDLPGGTAMTIVNTGNVGIGTSGPTAKLHIAVNNANDDTLQIFNGSIRTHLLASESTNGVIYMRSSANSNTVRINASGDSYFNGGNVGIGVTGPQSKLQVDGGIQMANDTATASAAKVGTMRYRTGTEYVEVTGTELVTNRDFATNTVWTTSGTVAISGGTANWTNAANGAGFYQAITFTANAFYKCVATVSNYSTGTFRFRYPGISSPRVSANGTYSFIIQANQSQNATLFLQGEVGSDANINFSIDNVSVMEVTAEDASYADMCMQTGASTYEWVNIVRNTY